MPPLRTRSGAASTMGVKKRTAPATQAHYHLRATKQRQEKEPEPINHIEDANMGDAPEVHVAPNATPLIPINPHQSPTQAGPKPSKQAQGDPTLPQKTNIGGQCLDRIPPASPTHESPKTQLSEELQSHITDAVASRTAQIKTTGDRFLGLVSVIRQRIAEWEERSLQGAISLSRDIRTLVINFSKNLATEHPTEGEENHLPTRSEYRGAWRVVSWWPWWLSWAGAWAARCLCHRLLFHRCPRAVAADAVVIACEVVVRRDFLVQGDQ